MEATKHAVTLYETRSTASGGRDGVVTSDDGHLDVKLDLPRELGGRGGSGTNPEQLFAAAWAGCFLSAIYAVARGSADLSSVRLAVSISVLKSPTGDFDLAAALDLDSAGIDDALAAKLMHAAHEVCPYSRATRGNIDAILTVDGVKLADAAS